MSQLPSEASAILAIVPPVAATTARTSSYVLPDKFHRLKATVLVGDASATGVLTLIKAANTSGGSSASIATAAYGGTGSVGDNKAFVFNVGHGDDFYDPVRPYFAIGLGDGVALTAAIIEGVEPRIAPPTPHADVTVVR
jgi:hypothetical protein